MQPTFKIDQIVFIEWAAWLHTKRSPMARITKVGRRWLTLNSGHRVDVKTRELESSTGSPPGRCFPNKEEFEQHRARTDAWTNLRTDIDRQRQPPATVSAEQIQEARQLLGL